MVYRRKKVLADGGEVEYPHYWYRFKRNGVQIRVNTKQSNRRAAEDLESAHKTKLAKGEAGIRDRRDVPTLKQFQKSFMEAIETRCAARQGTVEFYKQKMASLVAFSPLAQARLDRIDEALVERFVQHRRKQFAKGRKKAVSPATVNRALATLRRALRLAYEWKLVDRVPRIRLLAGERNRDFVLGRESEPAYLAACPQPLRDVATLILDTGLRVGEALRLEWSDVHFEPAGGAARLGYIRVRSGKSKNAKRVLSLTARAAELLRSRRSEAVDQFVFSSGFGDHYGDAYMSHLQQELREKLKWADEFVIHSLRHTMLTRLGEAGVDAFTIMKIAGHSTITVSQRYVHPTPEAVESAFEKLEAANAAKRGHMVGTPSFGEGGELAATA